MIIGLLHLGNDELAQGVGLSAKDCDSAIAGRLPDLAGSAVGGGLEIVIDDAAVAGLLVPCFRHVEAVIFHGELAYGSRPARKEQVH
jgi:hypothetical protein